MGVVAQKQAGNDSPMESKAWYGSLYKRSNWIGIGLLLAAFAVRTAALWWASDSLQDDPDDYARLATTWAEHGVFGFEKQDDSGAVATAYRPPGYPWLLHWFVDSDFANHNTGHRQDAKQPAVGVASDAIAGLHLLLGIATVWLVYRIGKRLELKWAWLAAAAVLVDPLLLRASQLVMTETLAALQAVLAWWLWLVVWPRERTHNHSTASTQNSPLPQQLQSQQALKEDGGEAFGSVGSCSIQRQVSQWLGLISLGFVLGLSILTRPTAAPWAALCGLCMPWIGCRCWKRRMSDTLIVALITLSCVLPWTLRNLREFGKPIWATTHGGYTLLLANNPLIYEHFRESGPSRAWNAEPFHAAWQNRASVMAAPAGQRSSDELTVTRREYWFQDHWKSPSSAVAVDELASDRLAYSAARATIERQPLMFVISCVYRVGWLWSLWPHAVPTPAATAIGTWYVIWFLLALYGLVRLLAQRAQWQAWVVPITLALSLTAIHAVFWSNMRMRSPVMPAVYLLAMYGIQCTWYRTGMQNRSVDSERQPAHG